MRYFLKNIVKIAQRWGLRPHTPLSRRRLAALPSDPQIFSPIHCKNFPSLRFFCTYVLHLFFLRTIL